MQVITILHFKAHYYYAGSGRSSRELRITKGKHGIIFLKYLDISVDLYTALYKESAKSTVAVPPEGGACQLQSSPALSEQLTQSTDDNHLK